MAFIDKLLLKLNPKTVIERSQYFDEKWYKEKYGISGSGAKHYLNEGWKLDYDPSPRFSSKDYLINNPDITGMNPLLHYEVFGKNEGRRPFVPKQTKLSNYAVEKIGIPYEEYEKKIDEKKVLSFDVFDTLVIRPFVHAEELFDHIEAETGKAGFADARKKAEREARKILLKEVNIDEIYDFIDEKYKELKQIEIRKEISFCHTNPMIRRLYDYGKEKGKRVIAVSDMYLPETVVSELLQRNGYQMDAVYVSCDRNRTKGSGELFSFVLEEEGISAKEMIHFGDNYISDYSEARNRDIEAFQTPKITDEVLSDERNSYLLSCYRLHSDLRSSIYIAQACEHLSLGEEPFFRRLAYLIGGPLVYAYLHFLCDDAKNEGIEKLFFVSRDGYCLEKVYEKYFHEGCQIDHAYAYLSRAAIYAGALNNGLCDDPSKILSIAKAHGLNVERPEENREELEAWSKRQDENLKAHLEKIAGNSEKIATVDMFSGNYTSEVGAIHYLNDRIVKGFYAGNFKDRDFAHKSFIRRILGMRDNLPVKMSEFLVTSYESGIIGVDEEGKPIYEEETSEERKKRMDEILAGIYEYIDDHRRFFEDKEETLFDPEAWIDLCDAYLKKCCDEDIAELQKVVDAQDPVKGRNDRSFAELIASYRKMGY